MFIAGTNILKNVSVTGNTASRYGGGIRQSKDAVLMLTDCTFSNNAAVNGGGLWSIGDLEITDCTFSENKAGDQGGGLHLTASATKIFSLDNVVVTKNEADIAGGIYLSSNNPDPFLLKNLTILENTATSAGGGIYIDVEKINLINALFAKNTAINAGGAYVYRGNAVFLQCSLLDNTASTYGGGILTRNRETASTLLLNSIVMGNQTQNVYPVPQGTDYIRNQFRNCLVEGFTNTALDNLSTESYDNLDGSTVSLTDLFADPANGYYSLLPATSVIDAGNSTFLDDWNMDYDLAGNNRIEGNAVDLGHYEYAGPVLQDATYRYEAGVTRSLVLEGISDPLTGYIYSNGGGTNGVEVPGVYTVTVTGNGVDQSATLIITDDNLIQFTDNNPIQAEIYDGSNKTLNIASVTQGNMDLQYNPSAPFSSGMHEVIVNAVEDGHILGSRTAIILIEKADLDLDPSTLVFADNTFTENGNVHSLRIQDEDQLNFDIAYFNNDQINAGVYPVVAELTHKTDKDNYYPIELIATMTINPRINTGGTDPIVTYYPVHIEVIGNGDVSISGLDADGRAAATSSLTVNATAREGSEFYSIVVNSGRILNEQPLENGGSFMVYGETTITVLFVFEGFDPNPDDPGVGNAVIDNGTKVWATDGTLHIRTTGPEASQVIALTGAVVDRRQVSGEENISLPKGIYIVRIGGRTEKVMVR